MLGCTSIYYDRKEALRIIDNIAAAMVTWRSLLCTIILILFPTLAPSNIPQFRVKSMTLENFQAVKGFTKYM
jgi:hypothetical protein